MKSTWLLLVGIAVGVLGCGTYFRNSNQDRFADTPDHATVSPEATANASQRSPRKKLWPKWNPNAGSGSSQTISDKRSSADRSRDQKPASNPSPRVATRPLVSNSPRPIGGVEEPTEEELIVSAGRVEARANRELDRLAQLLDLTEEQQDRIFPLLARSSTAYHPALAIQVGDAETSNVSNLPTDTSTSTETAEVTSGDSSEPLLAKEADEEIHDVLTDDQQAALEDAIIDEDLWWSDIIDDLEDELDESTELTASEAAAEEAAAAEDTSYSGNSGIGGLLGN